MRTYITFHSINHALKSEKICKNNNIDSKLQPVPRNISSDCGVCLTVSEDDKEKAIDLLRLDKIVIHEIFIQ